MDTPTYRVVMQGLTEDIMALERFAPDLKRELNKSVKSILAPIVLEAKGYLPENSEIHPSGWGKGKTEKFTKVGPLMENQTRGFIGYDAGKAKAGIKQTAATSKKNGTGFRNTYGVVQRDPAGAIFETAGRGSGKSRRRTAASRSRNPNASRDFIKTIEDKHKKLPTAMHQGKDKGRAVIRAVDNNRYAALEQIKNAVASASWKAQRQIDKIIANREV